MPPLPSRAAPVPRPAVPAAPALPSELWLVPEGEAASELRVPPCAVGALALVTIGRQSEVLVAHPFVSSRHCTAILNQGRIVLKDTSLNGLFVNDEPLAKKGERVIDVGDVVGIPLRLERSTATLPTTFYFFFFD